jgi:hypothetical protein
MYYTKFEPFRRKTMNYFKYEGSTYYFFKDFCENHNVNYEAARFFLRRFGGKDEYFEALRKDPESPKLIKERYSNEKSTGSNN